MPAFLTAQNTLTIKVEGVPSSEGYIAVGIYKNAESFLEEDGAYMGTFAKTIEGTTLVNIPDIPKGTYAVSIFHDENGNKKLDTNFIGIPKESCAFSRAKMRTFGPPDFEDCTFVMNEDFEITIPFE